MGRFVGLVALALLALAACKVAGAEVKPVERAVIDVPTQPAASLGAPKVIEPKKTPGLADSDLAHDVADILNGFSKATQCQDFDYFPEGGYQNFWCHRPAQLTLQAMETRAAVPIFLSGPHTRGSFDSKSKNDFGHYNPAFVHWLAEDVAPHGKDSASVLATQAMYDAMMKPLATIFHLTSKKVRAEPTCFTRERDGYQKLLVKKKLPEGYYERWFFFMNPEFCPRMAKGQTSDQYYYQHGMDGGVDGNVVKTVLGFFIRRSLDGTLPEFERALDKLIAAYQPDLLTAP